MKKYCRAYIQNILERDCLPPSLEYKAPPKNPLTGLVAAYTKMIVLMIEPRLKMKIKKIALIFQMKYGENIASGFGHSKSKWIPTFELK